MANSFGLSETTTTAARYEGSTPAPHIRLGTAGWTIPRNMAGAFPAEGSGLERYAARFNAAEINSSFYRSPKPETYARWAASTPEGFRFAVKLPKAITHERRLVDAGDLLHRFFEEVAVLGPKLGPVLIQLPPSLAFDPAAAAAFFTEFRARFEGPAACEPRHPSWFTAEAGRLLSDAHVARVAADPARVPEAAEPGGWPGLVYYRLHGSPRMYWSAYPSEELERLAVRLSQARATAETWCIFDNTASGAAAENALELMGMLARLSDEGIRANNKDDAFHP